MGRGAGIYNLQLSSSNCTHQCMYSHPCIHTYTHALSPPSLSLSHLSAAPSQPTQPALEDRSLQVLTISFSVKFGSAPIDYYLLRIFDSSDLTDTTDTTNATLVQDLVYREVNISSGDVGYVKSEEGIVEGGKVVGYEVTMRVRGLQQGRRYVFSVAAGSEIGEGDYSDLSDPFSLEDGMYIYIVCIHWYQLWLYT